MRISLLDDLASYWLFARYYSARPSLPSKQPVAGSNPAGRAGFLKNQFKGHIARSGGVAFSGAQGRCPHLLR